MTSRYLMKGGYWKNSEDEVLKAAVMKYGLNQWPRIASLISRKTAKQCKARWYEWLDPAIKKTEWSREENEKLLHLARVFPSQWRTIAPLVGRTPHQCLEQHEALLAQLAGDDGTQDAAALRRPGPGEIDPTPEVRPARADPMQMDDDEIEMIAELRVRLANRRGRKAKRKARERVIEETRRLAQVQKFRELRNAGIDFIVERKQKKKRLEFDYGEELPLERQPEFLLPNRDAGDDRPQKSLANINITLLEGDRKAELEKTRRLEDMKKVKRLNELNVSRQADRLSGKNPFAFFPKEPLKLSEPQLSAAELRGIEKMRNRGSGDRVVDVLLPELPQLQKIRTPLFDKPVISDSVSELRSLSSFNVSQARSFTPNPFKSFLARSEDLSARNVLLAPDLKEFLKRMPRPRNEVVVDVADAQAQLCRVERVLPGGGLSLVENSHQHRLQELVGENLREYGEGEPADAASRELLRTIAERQDPDEYWQDEYLTAARDLTAQEIDAGRLEAAKHMIIERAASGGAASYSRADLEQLLAYVKHRAGDCDQAAIEACLSRAFASTNNLPV